ncbi:MAG: 3,4-dihydroxy-2-butanone-4-phosphate synthase [Chloroflexi bacterium]|nr:3,4-dihydroxy-2-butanone-4-phosphate synthase [Chloroflexota bacterium]
MAANRDAGAARRDTPERVAVPEAIAEFRQGRPVLIVDDEGRENEGDLCIPAQFATAELIALMASGARGLICVAMSGERLDALNIPLMTGRNTSPLSKQFTVTVEARDGVASGASAADRARTIQVLVDPSSRPEHLTRPGHTFPLRAREGGVLVRAGHTEASVDLCKLAGCAPAAVICEMIREDGSVAGTADLVAFARTHGFKIVTVNDLIAHRLRTDTLIERVTEAELPSRFGQFRAVAYRTLIDTREHVAFVIGDVTTPEPVLVRVHDQCVTGDVFQSLSCDCGYQLRAAMELVGAAGRGVVVYLYQEGRAVGLHQKGGLSASDSAGGMAPVEELGLPDYGIGMQILRNLGVQQMRLITDNPVKRSDLEAYGLEIVELVPPDPPVREGLLDAARAPDASASRP